jgi:hypothetical protein
MTTDYNGNLFIDIQKHDHSSKLVLDADVKSGKMTNLDQRLWLEGNLSIGYGRNLSNNGADIFALRFESGEAEAALKIPASSLHIKSNNWYPGLFRSEPSQIACFPYAQHFVSDSPGHSSSIKNRSELEKAASSIDFAKIKVFSTKSFKTMFIIGTTVSAAITLTLLLLLIFKK